MTLKLAIAFTYLAATFYFGYLGWKHTREASDYMLAGRRMNPLVMALSYGATFISTSAIVGFGGAASLFGFPLLWLTFANIFVGIFVAFVFFGRRTRRMGVALDSHTFPELLGRRYKSRFIQGFSGLVIFLFIPIYAAAVLIGISRMIEVSLGIPYFWALVGFTLIIAVYVITGGMKAVMYTDALQGGIMVAMMLILVAHTYSLLGGVVEGHQALTDMVGLLPEKIRAGGVEGWTQGTRFGTPLWMTIYTTLVFGVGVGVLAQPQLIVRYMTVSSDRELNRGVLYGGVFILVMTGVAYVVGALSNVIFFREFGQISIAFAGGNADMVMPSYIERVMPAWFSTLFLMAMLAAAMSTLSAQYHTGGTSLGRDLLEKGLGQGQEGSIKATRAGVIVTILMALVWAMFLPESVIAKATAFFFGLCAATFLPVYFLGLYWKRMTRAAAVVSMLAGFLFSVLWLLFAFESVAKAVGLCQALFGKATLMADATPGSFAFLMQWLDPNLVALPLSFAVAVLGALVTRHDAEHAEYCWRNY